MALRKYCTLFILLLLSFSPLIGSNYCCRYSNEWSLNGEWLYWRARRCDLDYAVPSLNYPPELFIGDVYEVTPSYDSGFRIGLQKNCGNLFFDAIYTYFRTSASDSAYGVGPTEEGVHLSMTHFIDLENTGPPQGEVGLAEGKWKLNYDVVEILAGYAIDHRRCLQSYVFGGFKFASIDQNLQSRYVEVPGGFDQVIVVNEPINMNAYGVDIGVGAQYEFCRLTCFGNFSYDALLGDIKRKFTYDGTFNGSPGNLINLKDQCWRMVSVINVQFGIGYRHLFSNCWCGSATLALGYEFHQWINLPDFLEFQGAGGEITFDRHLQSLGFDGLFLRASLSF